mmetsp:Transcript_17082/g.51040  ORF Transcript_17082/g.51040 Transcript_17082/m.51040 type:complete len:370 (-) Transcript_17082:329-1438(-)
MAQTRGCFQQAGGRKGWVQVVPPPRAGVPPEAASKKLLGGRAGADEEVAARLPLLLPPDPCPIGRCQHAHHPALLEHPVQGHLQSGGIYCGGGAALVARQEGRQRHRLHHRLQGRRPCIFGLAGLGRPAGRHVLPGAVLAGGCAPVQPRPLQRPRGERLRDCHRHHRIPLPILTVGGNQSHHLAGDGLQLHDGGHRLGTGPRAIAALLGGVRPLQPPLQPLLRHLVEGGGGDLRGLAVQASHRGACRQKCGLQDPLRLRLRARTLLHLPGKGMRLGGDGGGLTLRRLCVRRRLLSGFHRIPCHAQRFAWPGGGAISGVLQFRQVVDQEGDALLQGRTAGRAPLNGHLLASVWTAAADIVQGCPCRGLIR